MDAALIEEAWLQAALTSRMQETVSLDFKSGLVFEDGKLSKEGRKALGAAMSALANSNGGTLVVGVDARPGKGDRVDCVQALVPIENLPLATSSMSQAVGELLQPKHDGVTVRAIACADDATKGYLVLEVPRSSRRPHMSQSHHQYFRRSGTSNYEMEHYDIEDMFKAVTAPALEMSIEVIRSSSGTNGDGPFRNYHIWLQLTNVGNVTAKHVNIQLGQMLPLPLPQFRDRDGKPGQRVGIFTLVWLPTDTVIHPGQSANVAYVSLSAQRLRREDDKIRFSGASDATDELRFRWTIGAENLSLAELQDCVYSLSPLASEVSA